jgi:hypothetical protein
MFFVAAFSTKQPVQKEGRVDMKLCGPSMAKHPWGLFILALFKVATSTALVTVPEMTTQPWEGSETSGTVDSAFCLGWFLGVKWDGVK